MQFHNPAFASDSTAARETQTVTNKPGIVPITGPELSIIVPTFKERDNVAILTARIEEALPGVVWEVVFVDDNSPDGTSEVLRQMAKMDRRIRVVRRVGRRGLSSAVTEGILSTAADYIAVMDADLQHDEKLLPVMLDHLRGGECDIVVGSRYVADGGVGGWDERRQLISRVATKLSRAVIKAELADPMSGFFMLSRDTFLSSLDRLSLQGYKILLDIVASSPGKVRIKEIPYVFRERQFGESKLDSLIALEYLFLLLDKMMGGMLPVRFVLFSLIGGLGLVVHMAILAAMLNFPQTSFVVAQSGATFGAMTFNFFLNNWLTYRDRRIVGAGPLLKGLLSFYAVCGIGAVANIGIASFVFVHDYSWWSAGLLGVLIGAVWNYAATAFFTWRV